MRAIFKDGVFIPQEPLPEGIGEECQLYVCKTLDKETFTKLINDVKEVVFGDMTEEQLKQVDEEIGKLS